MVACIPLAWLASYCAKTTVGEYVYFYWTGLNTIAAHISPRFLFRKAGKLESRYDKIRQEVRLAVCKSLEIRPTIAVEMWSPLCRPLVMKADGFEAYNSSWIVKHITKRAVKFLLRKNKNAPKVNVGLYDKTWRHHFSYAPTISSDILKRLGGPKQVSGNE